MDKKTGIIIGGIILAFGALVGISALQQRKYDYNSYDITGVIEPDEASGGIGDFVNGEKDAPVILVEYGNYQCTACAPLNPYINDLVKEYDGKLAVVFRAMSLPDHPNGTASAAAAAAAGLQGYWKAYKDILYTNQDDWFYSNASQRTRQFEEYFMTVSNNEGDLERFRKDMASSEVAQKVTFDEKMAARAGADWSPYFTLNGELISQQGMSRDDFIKKLKAAIDAKL